MTDRKSACFSQDSRQVSRIKRRVRYDENGPRKIFRQFTDALFEPLHPTLEAPIAVIQ
jgi:hypothetical protein